MQIKEVKITPHMAQSMLKKNTSNRPLSERLVSRYVKEVKSGNWKMTGDTIKLSKQGNLIDGQHRLKAVVVADVPITSMIAYGVEDNCFEVIDTGKKRSHADVLSMEGYKHTTQLAAALRLKYAIDEAPIPKQEKSLHTIIRGISNTEILDLIKLYPKMPEAVMVIKEHPYCGTLLTVSAASVCAYEFEKIDRPLAHMFFEKIETGADLSGNSPLLHLRNDLIKLRNTPGVKRMSPFFTLCAAYTTWNHLIGGGTQSSKWLSTDEIPTLLKTRK